MFFSASNHQRHSVSELRSGEADTLLQVGPRELVRDGLGAGRELVGDCRALATDLPGTGPDLSGSHGRHRRDAFVFVAPKHPTLISPCLGLPRGPASR